MELWKITGVANDSVAHELHNICHHSAESSMLLLRVSEVLKDRLYYSQNLKCPLSSYVTNMFVLWDLTFYLN